MRKVLAGEAASGEAAEAEPDTVAEPAPPRSFHSSVRGDEVGRPGEI